MSRIRWEWGDGATEEGWFPAQHGYKQEGTYTISVTAYDGSGHAANQSSSVTVRPALPSPLPAANLSGEWLSTLPWVRYQIAQEGGTFSWEAPLLQEHGQGVIVGRNVWAEWTNPLGPGSGIGRITHADAEGRASRIVWDTSVVFFRDSETPGLSAPVASVDGQWSGGALGNARLYQQDAELTGEFTYAEGALAGVTVSLKGTVIGGVVVLSWWFPWDVTGKEKPQGKIVMELSKDEQILAGILSDRDNPGVPLPAELHR